MPSILNQIKIIKISFVRAKIEPRCVGGKISRNKYNNNLNRSIGIILSDIINVIQDLEYFNLL